MYSVKRTHSRSSSTASFLRTFFFFGFAVFGASSDEMTANLNEDYSAPSEYLYAYNVNDPTTGDEKRHHETNFGGVVRGFYSIKEADGTTRQVHYTADERNGFTAHVTRIGQPRRYLENRHRRKVVKL